MSKIKKCFLVILLVIANVLLFTNMKVFAVEPIIQIVGADTVKEGYQTMQIKIKYDEEIGAIEFVIKGDDNVEDIQVDPSYNGWSINYNGETGTVLGYNPYGVKEGDIIQFKYKVKNVEKSAKISLSNIELTTLSYNTINVVGNVEKNISENIPSQTEPTEQKPTEEQKNSEEQNPAPEPSPAPSQDTTNQDKTDTSKNETTNQDETDTSKNNTINQDKTNTLKNDVANQNKTNESKTNTANQNKTNTTKVNTTKANTTTNATASKKELPKAGLVATGIGLAVIVSLGIAIVYFRKYKTINK